MFQLTSAEAAALRSQIVTSNEGRGGRRYAPYVFVELRRVASSYAALENRVDQIEREMNERLGDHDERLSEIFRVLHQMIAPPPRSKRPIGFRVDD